MSNYNYNSIVNSQEAEALKEMIFKRARERAEESTREAQENYTNIVRTDVMDLARNSFTAGKNPFAINEVKEEKIEQPAPKETTKREEEIGFSQKHIEQMKAQIVYKSKAADKDLANNAIEDTMNTARSEFESNKSTFMGALNFLNAQASISLVNKKGKKFEALA